MFDRLLDQFSISSDCITSTILKTAAKLRVLMKNGTREDLVMENEDMPREVEKAYRHRKRGSFRGDGVLNINHQENGQRLR